MKFEFKKDDDLESFGRDLTKKAEKGEIDKIIGRDDEIRRIIRILSRKNKNNPILIGEPGVGKTAIIEGLANRIINDQVPENLKNKQIIEINVGSLIAGASFQGQFEKRLKTIINKVEKSKGEIIVFIDEFHTLIGIGKNQQGGLDGAQLLKPLLARGESRIIGATTLEEYQKYIETDAAFERRMQKVFIEETTINETITILRGIKDSYERFHGIKILDEALIAATNLSKRYITDRFLPDKAIDLIDEAAASIKTQMHSKPEELEKLEEKIAFLEMEKIALNDKKNKSKIDQIIIKINNFKAQKKKIDSKWAKQKAKVKTISDLNKKLFELKNTQENAISEGKYEEASKILYQDIPKLKKQIILAEKDKTQIIKETIDEEEIYKIISYQTKIPLNKLIQADKEKIINLRKILKKHIKGQDQAIDAIYKTIIRTKANINNPNRPLGSFLFMGPTGVGKTELAKVFAAKYFNSTSNFIKIDMSEYMEENDITKIIGSPPGYIGFESGGQLTKKIRNNPHSVVLFDEIEKAHTKIHNILLQILEDGQITDAKGRLVNFKNTIIIMTTNIAANDIFSNKPKNSILTKLQKQFKREIINRIDEIVIFNPLTIENVKEITINELQKFNKRLEEKNYFIEFDKTIINWIVKKAYNIQYGARPLRRFIEQNIEFDISEKIIKNKIEKNILYKYFFKENKIYLKQKQQF